MQSKYKTFKNPLFITNNKMLVEVFTEKEKQGKEENQAPYRKLNNL